MLTEKRGADVLVPFIRKWIRPGSILISDCWAGYTSELDEFYLRERVNHSDEFAHFAVVDGLELSANTNHIEREWREVREVLWRRVQSSTSTSSTRKSFDSGSSRERRLMNRPTS